MKWFLIALTNEKIMLRPLKTLKRVVSKSDIKWLGDVRAEPSLRQTRRCDSHLPRSWNMPLWAWWLVIIILLFVVFISIKMILLVITRFRARLILHHQLKHAVTHNQLRQLVIANSGKRTLSQWAGNKIERQIVANKLNKSFFSNDCDAKFSF